MTKSHDKTLRKAETERQQAEEERKKKEAKQAEEAKKRADEEEAARKEREGGTEGEGTATPTIGDVISTLFSKGKAFASKIFNMKFFDLAKTPEFMKKLGLTGSKFTIRYGVISRHFGKDGSHDFTKEEWEQIPNALGHPFAIARLADKDKGFRIYTTLKTEKGEYVVVGVDVRNAGRNMEINAISTLFGRRNDANLPTNEEIIYRSETITPEQEALLSRPNSDQYPTERELTGGKGTANSAEEQGKGKKMEARQHKADVVENPSHGEEVLRDAVIDRLRESGIEVLGAAEGQKVLDMANGKDVRLEAKRKRALETASLRNNLRSLTVIPSADGAKVLKKIDILTKELEKLPTQSKTFIGDVAKALGTKRYGSSSEYATFETKNGKVVTIRLSNHNAKVAVLEDTVEKLEQERAAAMSQAVDEEQQHKVQETLDWFAAKMSVFSKEEQEAINACAIAFAERDQMVIPKVNIAVNAKCSQADLMAYASSAFFKIGKKRKDIARFLCIVFEAYFPGGEGFVYKKMPGAKQ